MRHAAWIAACLVLLAGQVQSGETASAPAAQTEAEAEAEKAMVQGCARQSQHQGGLSAAASLVLCQCSMDELKKTYSVTQISALSSASAAEQEEFGELFTEFVQLSGKVGERCFKDFSEKNPLNSTLPAKP